jgi:hypothetical protein
VISAYRKGQFSEILKTMSRKPFPVSVETSVLLKCKRRCALCFGLNNDSTEKRGQLTHIEDGETIEETNAAWLCMLHHDLYDSRSRQTKGYTPAELRSHQETLWAFVTTIKDESKHKTGGRREKLPPLGVTLDVYERRLPIYLKARQFVRDVCVDLNPDIQLILKFAWDTDEALFLFDSELADYLETLFRNALRLHTTAVIKERMLTRPDETENYQAIMKEDMELALWFTAQPQEIRARFAPFLRLA